MGVAFVARTEASSDATANLQWTHTVSAGSDRILVIVVALRCDCVDTIYSVKYGGVSVTKDFSFGEGYGNNATLWIGHISEENLETGAHTVSVQMSFSRKLAAGCVEYSGASQADWPWKNKTNEAGWSAYVSSGINESSSKTADTDGSDLALGFCSANSGEINMGQTVRIRKKTGSPTVILGVGEIPGDGGTKNLTFTHHDDTFVTTANTLQGPQDVQVTPDPVEVVISARIGSIEDGNVHVTPVPIQVSTSARIGWIRITQVLEVEMTMII